MIEKIRISLWDVFTFFFTGVLAVGISVVGLISYSPVTTIELIYGMHETSSASMIFALLVGLTLIGMLVEPFSNFADKVFFRWIFKWIVRNGNEISDETKILEMEIREKYLGSLIGQIKQPYALCKEYVETKGLSSTFMVFLSRFGFYRNCAFLFFLASISILFLESGWPAILKACLCFLAAAMFKRRSQDFYNYLAPAVYRAFLIDKLSWVSPDHEA